MNLPNRITVARILLIPVILFFQLSAWIPGNAIIAAVLFVIGALSDMIDGHLARKHNLITTFGKFMDPIADKLLVVSSLVVLVAQGAVHPLALVIILAREFLVSGFRLVVNDKGVVVAASMLGKIKTTLQIVAVVMAMLNNWPFSLAGFPMADIVMWAAVAMTLWSGVDYFIQNGKLLFEGKQ